MVLTQEEAERRHRKSLTEMLVLEAITVGEEPSNFYEDKPRKKRRKIPKRLAAEEAYENCLKRRRGHRGNRRCTSLFYADCLNKSGITRSNQRCKAIARTRL